jgi:hypothetical protein
MDKEKLSLLVERVNLRLLLVATLVVGGGLVLLYISGINRYWRDAEPWQVLLRTLGSSFVVTGGLTMIWNFFGKRAFLDEILQKVGVAKELEFAGLSQITNSFYADVKWDSLFHSVRKLDLFFAYAQTWRNSHTEQIRRVARTAGTRIRVVLPDPDDIGVVAELARRFSSRPEEIKAKIEDAERYFVDLCENATTLAEIRIWLLPAAPQFSFYRFDKSGVITLYSHRHERSAVPSFVVERGGTLYDYLGEKSLDSPC